MSDKAPQPPDGYYKPYKVDEYIKGFFLLALFTGISSAILGVITAFILMIFDNSRYALEFGGHAFANKFNVSFVIFSIIGLIIGFNMLLKDISEINTENYHLRKAWEKKVEEEAEKERKWVASRASYRASYDQYLPIFKEWQRQLTTWQEERAALEKFNPALEDYNRHAQGLAVEFEALWREVELHARLVLEVTDRSTVIEIFKQAFRESLARKPSMGLFRTYVFDPPFQPEQFPEGHIGRSEDFAFWMLLLRSTRSIEYLDGDDRLHAVKMDLPQFSLPADFPFFPSEVYIGPTKPSPPKPEPPPNLRMRSDGTPFQM